MKKLIIIILISVFVLGCGKGDKSPIKQPESKTIETNEISPGLEDGYLPAQDTGQHIGKEKTPKSNTTYDKYLVDKIPLLRTIDLGLDKKGRFSDMTILLDGTKMWLCDDLHSKTVDSILLLVNL
jgi:hypothetical protein